jgi:hypothetical protein
VVSPWTGEDEGRVVISNGVKLKTWTGGAGTITDHADGNAYPCKYMLIGPDNRLLTFWTVEGGSNKTQRMRWSVVGDGSDFTSLGSGALDIANDNWQITAAWSQFGRVFIGKERSIVALTPTGVANSAFGYEIVQAGRARAGGEGVFIPFSIAQLGNNVAFISHRDVVMFDGVNMQSVGGAVRRHLFRRLNYEAIDRITSITDAVNDRVGWGLPLDGSAWPNEIWWLDFVTGLWEIETQKHTSLSLYFNVDITTVDELPDTVDALGPGSVDSLSATASSQPRLILGYTNGATSLRDDSILTDNGVPFISEYITPAIRPVGQTIGNKTISHLDRLVLDEVRVSLEDLGEAYTVSLEASSDSGLTWTALGNITTTTVQGASDLTPRIQEASVHSRLDMDDQIQLRLKTVPGGKRMGFVGMEVSIKVSGRKR